MSQSALNLAGKYFVRSLILMSVTSAVTVTSDAAVHKPAAEFFYGTWQTGGEAGMSIYGDIKITARSISWEGSRSSPKCQTTYTVVDRTRGPRPYPDEGWPWKDIPSSATYETVKIRLRPAQCIGSTSYFRFAVASDVPNHMDVVEYAQPNRPNGWFSYGKSL